MQDIIQKIIEIDRKAQKMTEEALALKSEAEASIESDKKALRDKYIVKARRRIEMNTQTEAQFLAESLKVIDEKYGEISKELEETYEREHDKWVDELFNKVIGGGFHGKKQRKHGSDCEITRHVWKTPDIAELQGAAEKAKCHGDCGIY